MLPCTTPYHRADGVSLGATLQSLWCGLRQALGKVTALGVLCCFALFVCLTLLASFFLPSHLSFKNMTLYIHYNHYAFEYIHSIYINYYNDSKEETN